MTHDSLEKGRKIADIMEGRRIMRGIRELYNISEIGNQPAFFNPKSVNRVWPRRFNEGKKKYALGSGHLTCERKRVRRKAYEGAESNYVTRSTCLKLIGHLLPLYYTRESGILVKSTFDVRNAWRDLETRV